MPNLINNEHVKLFASFTNTIAASVLTVGVSTPIAISVYGIGELPKNQDLLDFLPIVCIWVAVALHLLGQWLLRLLEDTG